MGKTAFLLRLVPTSMTSDYLAKALLLAQSSFVTRAMFYVDLGGPMGPKWHTSFFVSVG